MRRRAQSSGTAGSTSTSRWVRAWSKAGAGYWLLVVGENAAGFVACLNVSLRRNQPSGRVSIQYQPSRNKKGAHFARLSQQLITNNCFSTVRSEKHPSQRNCPCSPAQCSRRLPCACSPLEEVASSAQPRPGTDAYILAIPAVRFRAQPTDALILEAAGLSSPALAADDRGVSDTSRAVRDRARDSNAAL